ncbi:MAG: pyridoxal-phosphate dependent enzyme [Candidatus Pacebacteria bacterium]|nr:pyridoxal-phosphate dependent enzyme [Candidatus Paceibacterota bacterium]
MNLSKKEEKILKSIVVASENNPQKPEFPADDPKFPATPTYRIEVPGFSNVWIKNESKNPTGTHKDRMAWEMIVSYRDFLLAKKRGQIKRSLPQMSIISFGSAATAIQTQLSKYKLPNLKVLIDRKFIEPAVLKFLKEIGCEIYETDLAKKSLTWKEILKLTHNQNGFDITSNEALDPTTRFYDWMSYEIINSSPDYCFIPFGTGNLYENILNINKKEVSTKNHDPRFKGDIKILRNCNFLGATSNNPTTKADKLYSPHLPFVHYDEQWIRFYRYAGFCGPESDVYLLKEEYLDKAMVLAKSQGIDCEYSGISGLALMLQRKNKLPKDKKMLVINTGKSKLKRF